MDEADDVLLIDITPLMWYKLYHIQLNIQYVPILNRYSDHNVLIAQAHHFGIMAVLFEPNTQLML